MGNKEEHEKKLVAPGGRNHIPGIDGTATEDSL